MLGTFMRDDELEPALALDDGDGDGGGTLGAFMRDEDVDPDDGAFVGDFVRSGDGTTGRIGGGELGPGRRAACD